MKKVFLYIFCAAMLAVVSSSCSKDVDIIPRATMSKIYAELFVADSWIQLAPLEDRNSSDTTAFYEPIFKKYGYTAEDYFASVEYYLNDPERYGRIIKKTRAMLDSEIKRLEAQSQLEQEMEKAEQERRSRLAGLSFKYLVYQDLLKEAFFTDRVKMELDDNGVYVPSLVQEEISFRGPKLVFKSDSLEVEETQNPHAVELENILRR